MKRLLLFAALIAWSGMASAVVYKWTDAQGKVQYGDRPPDGVHAVVVELLGTHAASARVAAPSTAQSAPTARVAAAPTPKDQDDRKAVDQDVAQTRDKQCTDAQDRYKKLIEGRRLYKTGPDGERQFMTSEEIDTERLNAKRDIDNICNSTT
jgi:Ni/Co efflux regulator RcnB